MEDFLAEFEAHLSSPEVYSSPTEELKARGLAALKNYFGLYKKLCSEELGGLEALPGCRHVDTGPLTELYTEGMDMDQIWEQLQLVTTPVLKTVVPVMESLTQKLERRELVLLADDGTTQAADKISPQLGVESGEELDEGEEGVSDEEEVELDSEEGDVEAGGRGRTVGRKSAVDDRFFKLSEMEEFLEAAEREDVNGKSAI